jgi:Raf kinase inhibitor-like YbhB/YbcL family protein
MRLLLIVSLLLAVAPLSKATPGALSSPDFAAGSLIPSRFTCQGENLPPTLVITGVPAAAQSLVLILDEPDAPSGTFTHWLVWNIPPGTKKLLAGALPSGALEGVNDFGTRGYSGPCPPSGTHRYFFRLNALDTILRMAAGASRQEINAVIRGHVLSTSTLMGRYAKSGF